MADPSRAAALRRQLALSCMCAALALPARADAQLGVQVRVGAIASTPLAVDGGVDAQTLDSLGLAGARDLSVAPGVAPLLALALTTPLRPNASLELSASWSFSRLLIRNGADTQEVGDVSAAAAAAGVRVDLRRGVYVRPALGALRYFGDEVGLFRDGTGGMRALIEVAAGVERPVAGLRVAAEALAQAHGFGTPALRAAGGADGAVYRYGVQVSVGFGGQP